MVALDFGMKRNILRHLVDIGCRVTVMPGREPARAILEIQPDGIVISNGPGDPEALATATAMVQTLIREGAESRGIPIFGICLGHQLLGQALGAGRSSSSSGTAAPTTPCAMSGPARSKSRRRTTGSRSTRPRSPMMSR